MKTKTPAEGGLLAKYQNKTTARSRVFYPVWTPAKPGEEILAEYGGTSNVEVNGGDFKGHNFKLKEWSESLTLIRQKNPVPAVEGMMISLSGAILDGSLKEEDKGKSFIIRYDGLGKKKGKKNGAKLFQVHEVD